jgi:alkylmercury lyase
MTGASAQLADQLQSSLLSSRGIDHDRWVLSALLPLLVQGRPVTAADLAGATGRPEPDVQQALSRQGDLETDAHGRAVGYGLTLSPTPHGFEVDGRQLYTWCALDTLMFPALLGRPARVVSSCHTTGAPVRLTVTPTGVTELEPPEAVVSVIPPDAPASVRSAFCHRVHFFASRDAAAPWLAERPDAVVLAVHEGYQLAQPLVQALMDGDPPASCR